MEELAINGGKPLRNKFLPYGHQWIDDEDIKSVVGVLKSDWITQGPRVKEFEEAIAKFVGAKYAVAVSSGTAGLHIACLAAGIKSGDEVVISPITFVASANCVLYCGAKPLFVDVQSDTINIDPKKTKEYLSSKSYPKSRSFPKAVIPVHFAGHPCDMEEIYTIAKKYNLIVIEDACHALGAQYKIETKVKKNPRSKSSWVKIGSCKHSDMTVFSFHPVKAITTGEGGAVLTNKRDLYEKLLMYRNHGITKTASRFMLHTSRLIGSWYYEMQNLGFNYRITDIQCALGISQLKKLDEFLKRRREIVQIYNRELSEIDEIELPVEKENVKSAWHLYPIRLKVGPEIENKRRNIFHYLRKNKIGVQVHYIPVYFHPYYQQLGYTKNICPCAEHYYTQVLTLPLYPSLREKDVKYVIKILLNALKDFS